MPQHGFDLVALLEGSFSHFLLLASPTDLDHGPAVDHGMTEASDAMDCARARDGEEDSGLTRDETIASCSVRCSLFVPEADESDAGSLHCRGKGGDWDAYNTEHALDAQGGKGRGHQCMTVVDPCFFFSCGYGQGEKRRREEGYTMRRNLKLALRPTCRGRGL